MSRRKFQIEGKIWTFRILEYLHNNNGGLEIIEFNLNFMDLVFIAVAVEWNKNILYICINL